MLHNASVGARRAGRGHRLNASPVARRLAARDGIDLKGVQGSGPDGRIIKSDLESAHPNDALLNNSQVAAITRVEELPLNQAPQKAMQTPLVVGIPDIPHKTVRLSNTRKIIARRLMESKQQIPHIYLNIDIHLDPLLKLRAKLNKGLEGRGVNLSVNDLLVKALAVALIEVPTCNVMLAGDQLVSFTRADISVAVSIPGGLITPVVTGADSKTLSVIATEIKDLAGRARDGKLAPHEYAGGTASLSNMGMFGIKQFQAVINPPQGMILAIGAGEKRPYIVDDELKIASVMSATGSFDHRAIDGADGAIFMRAFKRLVENPLVMLG